MKANELRIGNWVMSANYKKIKREIKDYSVEVIRAGDIHHLETFPNSKSIKPTPLTEEWLLKFGFEKIKMESILYSKYSKGDLGGIEIDLRKSEIEGWQITYCNYVIQHVHQLQNLYFALTGEELTIDEQLNHEQSKE